ncbi:MULTISPECIES: hypothetical protein [unclassified Nostoc]|uniref:hypothetical protein n=1 Tax=unclassified Nostoc TaxID=2593658 RepID=UPI002AD41E28|nr:MULTISPECIES: hypothetical protein [unclassified Nostoc]MDZ8122224.1 hypothetical protein [Nostoc sp. CmiVER01]MDZ8225346.1 hypothetical protein [Nostoc sp. ChiVER01]
MKKVLGLSILATLLTSPALAGETFVLNQWTIQQSRTETNFNIDNVTNSNRTQDYNSSSNNIYIDRKVETEYNNGKIGEFFKNFTVQNTGGELNGSFYEERTARVWGTINTIMNSYSTTHESSAGIR